MSREFVILVAIFAACVAASFTPVASMASVITAGFVLSVWFVCHSRVSIHRNDIETTNNAKIDERFSEAEKRLSNLTEKVNGLVALKGFR